ncbi:hypothetical protein BV25DRAFT_1695373 [Artomyces pyxidatus]|uniref:Uncharacterized protein n=1 Tax=Artomyces pyxidatus TaxID=48021 RepID=A0ACB8TAJ4_9AGAM|nr:hypothetical protein BV25DRAFT_1695373 [Artomyces pyxidatus]
MSGSKPASIFRLYRVVLFGLVLVSGAVLCSIGVWNLSQAESASVPTQVQAYIVFVGVLSILVIIPVLYLDTFLRHAVTGRVWLECIWVGCMASLHLSGAAAITTRLPHEMCSPLVELQVPNSCTSTQALEAFAWLSATNLLLYFALLSTSALLHQRQDDTVWHASVKSYPWYLHSLCHRLISRPVSPSDKYSSPLPAPQAQRPIILPTASLQAQYEIEHLSDRDAAARPEAPLVPVLSALQQARKTNVSPRLALYPLHIQAVMPAAGYPSPQEVRSVTPTPTSATKLLAAEQPPPPVPPLPLGDWPRRDIMQQPPPQRSARKAPPVASAGTVATETQRASRPTGPRRPRASSDAAHPVGTDFPSANYHMR